MTRETEVLRVSVPGGGPPIVVVERESRWYHVRRGADERGNIRTMAEMLAVVKRMKEGRE